MNQGSVVKMRSRSSAAGQTIQSEENICKTWNSVFTLGIDKFGAELDACLFVNKVDSKIGRYLSTLIGQAVRVRKRDSEK